MSFRTFICPNPTSFGLDFFFSYLDSPSTTQYGACETQQALKRPASPVKAMCLERKSTPTINTAYIKEPSDEKELANLFLTNKKAFQREIGFGILATNFTKPAFAIN
ncbi:hypothetical protein [Mesobacillus maritimus]|uniref:Uncharacterized protein n=1 Tax=Mesobacillus maritimus TaxID=1643336 RepID=A0ABS7K8Y3_9BACI|nr:hypothetical protein [Mesobacillus maritimus]MBY0098724.1 hypothetical protein [Mesobacillus maritimus]